MARLKARVVLPQIKPQMRVSTSDLDLDVYLFVDPVTTPTKDISFSDMEADKADSIDDPFSDYGDIVDDGEPLGDDEIDDWAALDPSDEDEDKDEDKDDKFSQVEKSPEENSPSSSKTSTDTEIVYVPSSEAAAPPSPSPTAPIAQANDTNAIAPSVNTAQPPPLAEASVCAPTTAAAEPAAMPNKSDTKASPAKNTLPDTAAGAKSTGRSDENSNLVPAVTPEGEKDVPGGDTEDDEDLAVATENAPESPTCSDRSVQEDAASDEPDAGNVVSPLKVQSPEELKSKRVEEPVEETVAPSTPSSDAEVEEEHSEDFAELVEEEGHYDQEEPIPVPAAPSPGVKGLHNNEIQPKDSTASESRLVEDHAGPSEVVAPAEAWGWGGSWGLGAISRLKQVAQGAVSDFRDLTGSLQQALAEVEDGSDAEEADRLLAKEPPADGLLVAGDGSTYMTAPQQAPRVQSGLDTQIGHLVNSALTRLGGVLSNGLDTQVRHSIQSALTGPVKLFSAEPYLYTLNSDNLHPHTDILSSYLTLLAYFQGLDTHVGHLAQSALTGLGGMLSNVARMAAGVPSSIPSGVSDDVHALQAAATRSLTNVAGLGTRLERKFESASLAAFGLLGGMANQFTGTLSLQDREKPDPATFEDFFYLYEGRLQWVTLFFYPSDSSDWQKELDDVLASLAAVFNAQIKAGELQNPNESAGSTSSSSMSTSGDAVGSGDSVSPLVTQRYAPISYLCEDSISRSENMKAMLQRAMQRVVVAYLESQKDAGQSQKDAMEDGKEIVEAPPHGESVTSDKASDMTSDKTDAPQAKTGDTDEPVAGGKEDRPGPAPSEDRKAAGAALATNTSGAGMDGDEFEMVDADEGGDDLASPVLSALSQVRKQSSKRLAEICAAQIELLLDLGLSLVAPSAKLTRSDLGVTWPDKAEAQAIMLKKQAHRMATDVEAVAAAFKATVDSLLTEPSEADRPDDDVEGEGSEDHEKKTSPFMLLPESELGPLSVLVSSMSREIEAVGSNASMKVMEGYRGLLYAILLRSIASEGPEAPGAVQPVTSA
eukprot:gene18692-25212_t